MTDWIQAVTLTGAHARLEPLAASHAPALAAAARDGELWRLWYTSAPHPDQIDDYVANALRMRDDAGALPFVVRRVADGQIVGCTRYFNVEARHRRLEIGHTWYSATVQRTALNTECKLLLLGHAFETLDAIAVELRTHFMNQASRRAIERLGAKLDGVLRQHQIAPDGSLRDTCVYSIVAAEWPAVRSNLRWKLEQPRGGAGD